MKLIFLLATLVAFATANFPLGFYSNLEDNILTFRVERYRGHTRGFLSCEDNGRLKVREQNWEDDQEFKPVYSDKKVALKSVRTGKYVGPISGSRSVLGCRSSSPYYFNIKKLGQNQIGLKADDCDRYLSVRNKDSVTLGASRLGHWEKLYGDRLVCKAWGDPHYIGLKKNFNDQSHGDQIFAETNHFDVHIRTKQWTKGTTVVIKTGVLIKSRYSKVKLVFYGDAKFLANGKSISERSLRRKLNGMGVVLLKIATRRYVLKFAEDFLEVQTVKRGKGSNAKWAQYYQNVVLSSYRYNRKAGLCVGNKDGIARGIFPDYVRRYSKIVSDKCYATAVQKAKNHNQCTVFKTAFEKDACVFDLCRQITIKQELAARGMITWLTSLINAHNKHISHHRHWRNVHRQRRDYWQNRIDKHIKIRNTHQANADKYLKQRNRYKQLCEGEKEKQEKYRKLYVKFENLRQHYYKLEQQCIVRYTSYNNQKNQAWIKYSSSKKSYDANLIILKNLRAKRSTELRSIAYHSKWKRVHENQIATRKSQRESAKGKLNEGKIEVSMRKRN